jgi:hypothetical protein
MELRLLLFWLLWLPVLELGTKGAKRHKGLNFGLDLDPGDLYTDFNFQ